MIKNKLKCQYCEQSKRKQGQYLIEETHNCYFFRCRTCKRFNNVRKYDYANSIIRKRTHSVLSKNKIKISKDTTNKLINDLVKEINAHKNTKKSVRGKRT